MNDNALNAFHQTLVEKAKATGESFNWHCDFEIPAANLSRVAMLDVFEEAAQWRQKTPAPDMYFSHGQFYEDGIQHIIDELKRKRTSNRALYSLLAQHNITGKGDKPIPSFLTFQCSIEGDILYCTASFRALEVGTFLKVNLEEIRQNLVDIYREFPDLQTVRLHIFAFHAYVRTMVTAALRKPEIDVTPERKLFRLMQTGDVRQLDELLGGLEKSTTAVSSKSLEQLLEILLMPDAGLHKDVLRKQGLLEPQLRRAIETCRDLVASREDASRGLHTTAKIEAFQTAVCRLREILLS